MPNALSKIFAVILMVVALYYIPLYQQYKKQEDLAYLNTYQATMEFADNVRMKGFISRQMYEDYMAKINIGEVLYNVEMTHKHRVYTPEYTDPTDLNTFTGNYLLQYDDFFETQILEHLYSEAALADPDRIYRLEKDDYFKIYVENKTKFKSTMLFDFLTANISNHDGVVISIPYGGKVLNEDY